MITNGKETTVYSDQQQLTVEETQETEGHCRYVRRLSPLAHHTGRAGRACRARRMTAAASARLGGSARRSRGVQQCPAPRWARRFDRTKSSHCTPGMSGSPVQRSAPSRAETAAPAGELPSSSRRHTSAPLDSPPRCADQTAPPPSRSPGDVYQHRCHPWPAPADPAHSTGGRGATSHPACCYPRRRRAAHQEVACCRGGGAPTGPAKVRLKGRPCTQLTTGCQGRAVSRGAGLQRRGSRPAASCRRYVRLVGAAQRTPAGAALSPPLKFTVNQPFINTHPPCHRHVQPSQSTRGTQGSSRFQRSDDEHLSES